MNKARVSLTPELKQQIIDLKLQKALKNKDIASQLNVSKDSVKRVLKTVVVPKEIKAKAYQDYTDEFLDGVIKELELNTKTIHEIAEQLNVTPSRKLQNLLYTRKGYRLNKDQVALARSKYSKDQKAQARAMYIEGKTLEEVANALGIKSDAVRAIVAGINKKLNKVKALGFTSYDSRIDDVITKRGGTKLGVYINNSTRIEIRCEKKHTFYQTPGDLLGGHWCDQCVHHTSKGELIIKEFIQQFVSDFEKGRGLLSNSKYEIDLYSPSRKIGIEFCGQYWHGERANSLNKTKHAEKFKQAEQAGIRLVTIYDSELYNNPERLEGYLKAILNVTERRLGARDTVVKQINAKVCLDFCDKHHIQGGVHGTVYYGLFYENELVATAIFKNVAGQPDTMDLARYCLPNGTNVVGGLGKVLAQFKKDHPNVKRIISFSDNRYSQGGLYLKNGFTLGSEIKPDYSYFKMGIHELHHKFSFRKAGIATKLGPLLPNETEWEAMQRFGYDRIWDCGKRKWTLTL